MPSNIAGASDSADVIQEMEEDLRAITSLATQCEARAIPWAEPDNHARGPQ